MIHERSANMRSLDGALRRTSKRLFGCGLIATKIATFCQTRSTALFGMLAVIISGRASHPTAWPVKFPFTMEAPVGFPLPNRPSAPPPRRGPNRRVTTTVVTVSALAASLLVSGSALPAQADPTPTPAPSAPVQTPFPLPEDPDAPLRAAVAEARKQNRPVEATGAFTETTRTWAFPDGSLKTESYSGPAQVKQDDGRWAWIDTTLVEKDGVLKPKVAKADVAFSLGGDGAPFAVMKRDAKQSLSLLWDGALPRPTVKGNVATYPDAAGAGADLVVTALPTGFRHDVVLRERPKGPLEIRIPVESPELTLTKSKQGGLQLTDDKDKVVAQAPRPVMWDSTGAGAVSRSAPISTSVVDDGGRRTLVLKPDAGWLADPATTFPVVVDPTSTLTVKTDTLLSSGADCNTNDQPGATLLKIGAAYYGCNGVDAVNYWRSYLRFDVAGLVGKPIISSTMQLWRTESPACHQRGNGKVYATRVNTAWTPGRMTWSNKPGTLDFVATPCPTTNVLTPGVMTWPITNWVKDWVAGQPNYGIGLEGPTENVDRYSGYSAVFHSAETTGTGATPPKLITQYILPPEIPRVTAESVDSTDGEHAIVRESSAKVGYTSTSVDGRNIDYYVSVVESTAPLPTWTTGGGEVGKWSFTEGTGGTDSSGKGNTLVFIANRYSWIDGKDGKALFLNGAAGTPSTASTEEPVLRTDKSFSAAGWVRLDVGTSTIPLISQSGTVNSAFSVGYESTGGKWNMQMHHDNTAGSAVTEIKSSAAAQIGTWTHLAGVYDAVAKKIRLYVNGVQAAEADYTATPWQADETFELGNGKHAGISYSSVKAVYDEIRAYDRALSPTEIQWMLNLTPPTNANLPSGQAASITYDVSNVDSFKISVRACINGATPMTCSESPYYRITTDAPYLPTDTETGMADPNQPILSGVVNRPSGGQVTAKYYLYDSVGAPVGSSPLAELTVNGGQRASLKIPANIVHSGRTYTWQMQTCTQEVCTPKIDPVSFTVPGEAPPEEYEPTPIALQQDHFVMKMAKIDPNACNGSACTFADSSTIQVGGLGGDKLASVVKIRLNEIPDGSIPIESLLDLGTPNCGESACPTDATIKITRLDNEVAAETKTADLSRSTNAGSIHNISITDPKRDIVGDESAWLLLESDSEFVINFGTSNAITKMSLTVGYLAPGPPSKVRNLTASPGDGGAIATWGVPENTGSLALLNGYDVEVLLPGDEIVRTLQVENPSATVTGLSNGTVYTLRVAARTRFGKSDWENITVTPKQVELPPQSPGSRMCPTSVGTQMLTAKLEDYYNIQNGVVEGHYPDVWSGAIGGGTSRLEVQSNGTLDPSHPMAAKLALINANLIAAKQGMDAIDRRREDSSVSISDATAYNAPNGDVTLRATVQHTWTEVSVNSEGDEHRQSNSMGGSYDFSFGKCGGWGTVVSVVIEVDTTGMDMVIEGPGPDGEGDTCGSRAGVAARTLQSSGCSAAGGPRGPNPNDVTAYQFDCAGDGCRFDTYGKQTVMAGMVLEAGGALRYKGYNNWLVGGPTAIDVNDLRGWARVNVTPAFEKAKKNKALLKSISLKLDSIAGFSIKLGSLAFDGGGPGVGFSVSKDSAQYSKQGSAGSRSIMIPPPDKVRPFTVGCDNFACAFMFVRHSMNVNLDYKSGGWDLGDPMRLESPWRQAITKIYPG
ncbi:LamG-like jellyroll fold domain-containing protein [Streptosporangium sp. NPDC049248]|uniref:LamG-like jellyroll fold domain-containing protein n=1 Tax=Streptosporangium sp. NPDC049248 TaxID=3155651 RepID=UPI003444B448